MPLLRFLARALLLGGLGTVAACGSRTKGEVGRGVLLIAVDGLRADHLGCYGYDRDTSPVLDALADQGLRFAEVFASAPLPIPAHAALLTGCEPFQARRFIAPEFESQGPLERRWQLPERLPRLAVEFLAAGYATAAFVEHPALGEGPGFAHGFQRYELLDPPSAKGWEGPQDQRVVEHFLTWLRALPSGRPWFAYLELNHLERVWTERSTGEGYFEPRPELSVIPPLGSTDSVFFAVPRTRARGGLRSLGQYEAAYDDELRALDAELGRLLATLRRIGRDAETTLSVVGSYGQQLGEAGLYLSSGRYSLADLHVPWILRPSAAAGIPPGQHPGLVSTLDVAPTLLELAGLEQPPTMHGFSQAGSARGEEPGERPFVFASCGLQEGCAVIGERFVLEYLVPLGTGDAQLRRSWTGVWSQPSLQPRLAYYDRRATPYPLLSEGWLAPSEELEPLRAAALGFLEDMSDLRIVLQAPRGIRRLDEASLERLRARGYLGRPGAP
jgi:arylsulfatase